MRVIDPAEGDWGGQRGGRQRDLPRWHFLQHSPGPAVQKNSYLRYLIKQVKREYGVRCIAEGLVDGERPCCRPGHDVGGGVSRFAYVADRSAAHWTTAAS